MTPFLAAFEGCLRANGNLDRPGGVIGMVVGRPLPEGDLVVRAKRGDVGAYEELVRMHQQIAFRTAHLITRDAGEAEDAAQDGFLSAYRSLGRFRAGAPFRPWLLRIVANEARNRRRSAGRRAGLALRAAGEWSSGDAAPSPEAIAVAADQRAAVLAALDELAEGHRLVIACRYLLELSEAETAGVLGCRRGTVKSRLARGLDRLRDEMGDQDA